MANKNTIFFGVGAIQNTDNTGTTTIALYDDVYLYRLAVIYNTTLAFDTTNLDPDKTAQGSDWGYQILLELDMDDPISTITFPSGIKWERGGVPVLNIPNHKYYVRLEFVDGEIFGCFEGMTV